jgi:transcriptional regulator with GAF, ATPase, and Fis domain
VEPTFRDDGSLESIIGTSRAIQKVLQQTQQVASTDANVLILGESGTGKELIANAIHRQSPRRHGPWIRVNCGAIPRELFESEFFGHVKGAFSGALRDHIGRFGRADGGTLFLDEIGELPLELQCKLLRVLQEGEYERLGECHVRKVNVRIIAATNRDLAIEVKAKRFRQDLYYRLNVVPLEVPPLRDRLEDIPLLARFFVDQARRKHRRPTLSLDSEDILALQRYDWPGNVRELQNIIERAVILSAHDRLQFNLPRPDREIGNFGNNFHHKAYMPENILTEGERKQRDRDSIRAALIQSKGKIYGPDGAAAVLGVKPSTLSYRMKVLGINKCAW